MMLDRSGRSGSTMPPVAGKLTRRTLSVPKCPRQEQANIRLLQQGRKKTLTATTTSGGGESTLCKNTRRDSSPSTTLSMAARFGYKPSAIKKQSSVDGDTLKKGNTLTLPKQDTMLSSHSSLGAVIEEDESYSFHESPQLSDTASDTSPPPPYKEKPKRNANLRQVLLLDSRNNELVEFEDSNAEASAEFGNVIDYTYRESDFMQFSPDSELFVFANEHAEAEEGKKDDDGLTWQEYKYDEELKTGTATIFCNFEDEDSV